MNFMILMLIIDQAVAKKHCHMYTETISSLIELFLEFRLFILIINISIFEYILLKFCPQNWTFVMVNRVKLDLLTFDFL